VRLHVAGANVGFPAGCNLGIVEALRSVADAVLLLNPDVVVRPGALDALVDAMVERPDVGVFGPVVLCRHPADTVESTGIDYSQSTGRMTLRDFNVPRSALAPFDVRTATGVSGCAMLIRREVFARVGLLDEAFFFGFEDVEFCLRARAAGFATACVGRAEVVHDGHASIGRQSASRIYYATRNHLRLATHTAGGTAWRRMFAAASVLTLNLAHAATSVEVPRWKGLQAFIVGVRDHLAGRYGPAPAGVED
jgi:hypothetical protein